MHVLIITTVHVPTDARIVHRQIRSLLDAGHQVSYAAAFTARADPPPGVRPIDLPAARGRRRLKSLAAARRLMSHPPTDINLIMIHDPELLLAVAAAGPAVPVVWDVHEDLGAALTDKAWLPKPFRRVTATAVARLERWAERRCHLLLAEEAYAARFELQHPVVLNLPWRRPAPAEATQPRAVYIGRVSRQRGADELIETARLLRQDGIQLVVAGPADADVRDEMTDAHRRGALQWHGYLPNPDALALLDGALAGLSLLHDVPNYRHSMPTKLLEYMERGLPVVTTPLPLATRLIEQHACGTVVDFRDPEAAARAVLALRADPSVRAQMAARARAAALEYYTWDEHAAGFVSQLERWQQAPGAPVRWLRRAGGPRPRRY